ncbi:DUF1598 domain-containing protein [bacterium]|nr:DUF1598 domain-containing protein [bacterium]
MPQRSWSVLAAIFWMAIPAFAQVGGVGGIGGAGGVWIDPEGILHAGSASKGRGKAIEPTLPEAIALPSELREISLKSIGEEIASLLASGQNIPPEIEHAAGLARIDYIILDRPGRDVRLAGPAEGFRILPNGRGVGKKTGRSIIKLEDLATAMRSVLGGEREIRCSIDPTKEGLAAIAKLGREPVTERNASKLREFYRDTIGQQVVTTGGVPEGSRFARVMVEADYLMKQMGVGSIKVRGIRSHLESQADRNLAGDFTSTLARWWFTSQYEPLTVNSQRSVFGIRGPRLRLLSEEMLFFESGKREGTGKPSRDQFADDFTDHIDELQAKYPAFSDLANLYDLVLVAALIDREGFREDWEQTVWLNEKSWKTPLGVVPREADAIAAADARKGKIDSGDRGLIISVAYGGVSIRPAMLLGKLPTGGPSTSLPTSNAPPVGVIEKLSPTPEKAPPLKKRVDSWWKDWPGPGKETDALRPSIGK